VKKATKKTTAPTKQKAKAAPKKATPAKKQTAASAKSPAKPASSAGSLFRKLATWSASGSLPIPAITDDATQQHHPIHVETWGNRFVVATNNNGERFNNADWIVRILASAGNTIAETARLTFDATVLARILPVGDALVLIFTDDYDKRAAGVAPLVHYETYRTSDNNLTRVADATIADTDAAHAALVALFNHSEQTFLHGDLLLVPNESKELVSYTIASTAPLALTPRGRLHVVFGESGEFTDKTGYRDIDVLGNTAVLSPPGNHCGFQLVDLSDPTNLTVINTSAGKFGQQDHATFVSENRFVAYGLQAKIQFIEYLPDQKKFAARKTLDTKGTYYSAAYADGDEVLLYRGRAGWATDVGCVYKFGEQSELLGKVKHPFGISHIARTDSHVALLGSDGFAIHPR